MEVGYMYKEIFTHTHIENEAYPSAGKPRFLSVGVEKGGKKGRKEEVKRERKRQEKKGKENWLHISRSE